ncbi:MAG: hypothetical protein ACT4PP_02005 [Sporichthyaceae bacterium]
MESEASTAVFLLCLAAWWGSYLITMFGGGVRAGGLYLTPRDVTYVKHGGWWRAHWEDISIANPGHPEDLPNMPMTIRLALGWEAQRGRTTRWGWKGRISRKGAPLQKVETRFLTADRTAISEVINLCKLRPEFRSQLGTPAALTWPEWKLEGTSVPQGPVGRPGPIGPA